MDSTTAFDNWLSDQLANGLVDIKFAILNGRDISSEAVKSEILVTELTLSAGIGDMPPQATSGIPDSIQDIINEVVLH